MDRQSGRLDQPRWLELWSRLGGRDGEAPFSRLVAAYAEPQRAYHTAEHICECLAELDLTRNLAEHPDEVEGALWFHDAVYMPGATDNEARSAKLAGTELTAGLVPPETTSRIAGLILATRHSGPAGLPDERLTCDVDLSVLGREPAVFDEYERRIRREYGWVPEPLYRRGRASVLAEFLRRPSIYQTDPFRQRYELSARANLTRQLAQLQT
jgi:predicted metal-dependent HD superfamily phosphohydrolase